MVKRSPIERGTKPTPSIPKESRDRLPKMVKAGMTLREMAAELGVSRTTVGYHLRAMGLQGTDATRKQTKPALEARRIRLADKRAKLVEGLLDDALWARAQMRTAGERVTARGDIVQLTRAEGREVQAFMTTIGIALQRSLELERFDGDESMGERSLLAELGKALGIKQDNESYRAGGPIVTPYEEDDDDELSEED